MNLKKVKLLDCILIFILCFLFHFAYEILPNPVFAILFPVNESIWEHMKIIYSSIIFSCIIDYIILSKKCLPINNLFTSAFFSSVLSIITYLIIYLPLYHFLGENMFISITLLFIIIVFSQYISYLIMSKNDNKNINIISIILIIIGYIVFGYLTYNPIENYLFYDIKGQKYGINIYKI